MNIEDLKKFIAKIAMAAAQKSAMALVTKVVPKLVEAEVKKQLAALPKLESSAMTTYVPVATQTTDPQTAAFTAGSNTQRRDAEAKAARAMSAPPNPALIPLRAPSKEARARYASIVNEHVNMEQAYLSGTSADASSAANVDPHAAAKGRITFGGVSIDITEDALPAPEDSFIAKYAKPGNY